MVNKRGREEKEEEDFRVFARLTAVVLSQPAGTQKRRMERFCADDMPQEATVPTGFRQAGAEQAFARIFLMED